MNTNDLSISAAIHRQHTTLTETVSPEEPLLTQYLREAVAALRRRERELADEAKTHSEALEIYRKQHFSQVVLDIQASAAAETKGALALTRASLAFWERLAAVEVALVTRPDGTLSAWCDQHPRDLAADPLEVRALINLAAALECRKRNGEVGL